MTQPAGLRGLSGDLHSASGGELIAAGFPASSSHGGGVGLVPYSEDDGYVLYIVRTLSNQVGIRLEQPGGWTPGQRELLDAVVVTIEPGEIPNT